MTHPAPPAAPAAARRLLDGAVAITTVAAGGTDGLFRAGDARGEVAWMLRGETMDHLHVAEFAVPGARRAFHRHARHRERVYVFRGALRLFVERDGVAAAADLRAGDVAELAPGTAHGFVALEPSIAVCYGTGADPVTDAEPAPELAARADAWAGAGPAPGG